MLSYVTEIRQLSLVAVGCLHSIALCTDDFKACFAGLAISVFNATPSLNEFFKVLSLSLDKKGVPYISTLEAQKARHSLLSQPPRVCFHQENEVPMK